MVDVSNPVNWTIKNIAEEAKDYALTQASAAGVPVGIWLEKLLLADKEGRPAEAAPNRLLVDLRPLAEIMRASADIMQASGAPIPKGAVRSAYTLLGLELREAKTMRREQIQQPKQRQIETDHAASIASSDTGSARNGNSGITPARARRDV